MKAAFKAWIVDRCTHEGKVTLSKMEFNTAFPGEGKDEMKDLEALCKSEGLKLRIHKFDETFTFKLIEPLESDFPNE